jgi:ribosomal protein S18 acetylase RimI-like enzyme
MAANHRPNLMIRELHPSDVAEYYPLRLRALREHPEAFSSAYEEQAGLTLENFASKYMEEPTPDRFMLGAWLDEVLVGNLALFRSPGVKTRHHAEIARMYVAPEVRRRGVGWALLEAVLGRARALPGLEYLLLGVTSTNQEAIALYRKAGFETIGRIPQYLKIGANYYDTEDMMLVKRPRFDDAFQRAKCARFQTPLSVPRYSGLTSQNVIFYPMTTSVINESSRRE